MPCHIALIGTSYVTELCMRSIALYHNARIVSARDRDAARARGLIQPFGAFPYQPMLARFADIARQMATASAVIALDVLRAKDDFLVRRGEDNT